MLINMHETTTSDDFYNPDILDCIASLSSDEVATPPSRANEVLDMLPAEVWSNPDLKWLDPGCKTGVFLREAAKRLYVGLDKVIIDDRSRAEHILLKMLHGAALTELTAQLSRRSLYASKLANTKHSLVKFPSHEGNIRLIQSKHSFLANPKSTCLECHAPSGYRPTLRDELGLENHAYSFIHQESQEWFKTMKFDVIIGNPPYQLGDGGGGSASPIYNYFVEQAIDLDPKYIAFIIPSRWFNTGKGLGAFRSRMLAEERIRKIVDFPSASEVFPGPDIKGGVCYILWDKDYSGTCELTSIQAGNVVSKQNLKLGDYTVVIRSQIGVEILKKVSQQNEQTMEIFVSSQTPFGLLSNYQGSGKQTLKNAVKVYGRGGVTWAKSEEITRHPEWVNKWKVLTPKASDGSGTPPLQVLSKSLLSEPGTVCSQTYLVAGVFDSKKEAEALVTFMSTKFFRFMVSLRKTTQDVNPNSFGYVPNIASEKKWTDEALYAKYELTESEIEHIESYIKE
jgi:site-specific DNA-methyltransferase (adenine-specific)